MTDQTPSAGPSGAPPKRWLSILLGLLLLLPAAVSCGTSLAGPTEKNFVFSLRSGGLLGPGGFVGAQNYANLPQLPGLGAALTFTLSIALVRLLAVAVMPPVLGLTAKAFSGWLRGSLRLLFTLPVALSAPTALAVSWALVARGRCRRMTQEPRRRGSIQ